jgi:hypothetical protein
MNCSLCLWSFSLCKGFHNRPYCLRCDLTVFYLIFHRLSALFLVILLIVLVTQFTTVLHAGYRVPCHNFLSLCLCFRSQSRPDRPQFRPEIVIILVVNVHPGAVEATKSRTALSASVHYLIWIIGNTKPEARL